MGKYVYKKKINPNWEKLEKLKQFVEQYYSDDAYNSTSHVPQDTENDLRVVVQEEEPKMQVVDIKISEEPMDTVLKAKYSSDKEGEIVLIVDEESLDSSDPQRLGEEAVAVLEEFLSSSP